MTSPQKDAGRYITAAELLATYDLTPAYVRRHCPTATEYTALDGQPCWLREELATWFTSHEGGRP